MKPLFSRQYVAMALRGTFQDETDLKVAWVHSLLEKLTIVAYLLLYPLAKFPVVSIIWEMFIRSYCQGTVGFFLRAAYWKTKLRKMGIDVFINADVHIWKPHRVEIGSRTHLNIGVILLGHEETLVQIGSFVHISLYTLINGRGGVIIEDYSSVGAYSSLYSGTHHHEFPDGRRGSQSNMWPIEYQHVIVAPIHMHRASAVRWGCIVLPGVEIGEWAVVGANSLVREFVPPETIVAGNPARKIGENKEVGNRVYPWERKDDT